MKYVFCLLFISCSCIAQVRFEQGYFIDENDARTECLIRNVGWLNNPSEFKYKIIENEDPLTKGLKEVREFGVADYKLVKAKVKLDTAVQELKKLNSNRYPEWKETDVFLKVVVEGKALLYSFKNENSQNFYFSVNRSPIEPLIYKLYMATASQMGSNLSYLQQLKSQVNCASVSDAKLKLIKYTERDLTKWFVNFNQCSGDNVITKKKRQKLFINFTPGLDFHRFELDNGYGSPNVYPKSASIRIGFAFEKFLPFNKGKWSAVIEPTYQSYRVTNVTRTSLEIPLGVRYRMFLNEYSAIFLNGFVVPVMPLKYEVYAGKIPIKATSPLVSGAVGAGFVYKRFSIEGRQYLLQSVLASNFSTWFISDKISVIAGYRINKGK